MPNPTPAAPASAAPATPPVASKEAVAPKPVVPAAPTPEELFDVQIDGKPEKRTRKEIVEAYQLRQLSDKRRTEADKVLGEYKKLQEVAARDPIKFMRALGYDFDQIATGYLAKKAEDSLKDPAVLESEKTKAELEQYKAWVAEQKANMERATKEKAVQVERERLHGEIIAAIEEKKDLGLPVDEHLIIQIAQDMLIQDKAKRPVNAKEALPQTYARTQRWLQGLASKMDGAALLTWLGDDVAKKIRKYDLSQLKAKRASTAPATGSAVKPPTDKTGSTPQKPYMTWSQFKKEKLDTLK